MKMITPLIQKPKDTMTRINKLIIGAFAILFVSQTLLSQELLNYANSLKYANYLFDNQQYDFATYEYERVLFMVPNDTLAKLRLVQSYSYLKEHQTALNRIETFFPEQNSLPSDFAEAYVKNLLYAHQYQKVHSFLEQDNHLNTYRRREIQLGVFIMQQQWSEASVFADKYVDLYGETEKYHLLHELAEEGLHGPYKSPAWAASLSAVIPGAGKFYTNRWKDAIFSLLFVSASSLLTYHSYQHNGLGFNSLFWGSITVGFYAANIYGSHKSAKVHNQHLNQSYLSRAEEIFLNDF